MNKSLFLRVRAALLPVVFFALLYSVYLHFFYQYQPHMPRIYQNWGYLLGAVLLVTRVINLRSLPSQVDHRGLLAWSLIGYNLLIVLGVWLLLGNVIAIAQLIRPFGENMIVHIFLLMLLSLGAAAELLWTDNAKSEN
ncbi:hypothetical protein [Hymenobacter arcticus]